MEYSVIFVCLMGMGTVFFGLVCLIALTTLLGKLCGQQPATAAPAVTSAPAPAAAPAPSQPELLAAISAAIAEELGTDITGIRILSIKKV